MAKQSYPIDTNEFVELGGYPQSIRIRGTDAAKPILLFLHGGPGVCDRHWVLKDHSDLTDVCTMVCWDQRGAGKSYSAEQAKRSMTIELMVSDACELVEYLCERFGKDKVFVIGHSWGTMLGTLVAQRIPERIAAYVGMGQVVDLVENEEISYQFCIDEATKRGDTKALKALEPIAPVNGSYGSIDNLLVQRNYMSKYGGGTYQDSESIYTSVIIPILKSSEYSLADFLKYYRGTFYSLNSLWPEIAETIRFHETVLKLDVPVYLTEGRHDQNTPPSIAWKWHEALEAPEKKWVWFEESGHSPIKEEPRKWNQTIRELLFSQG